MNVKDLHSAMAAHGLDAVVTVMPENVYYSTGTLIITTWDLRDRLALGVFPNGGDPTLIVCDIEEPQARAESWIKDIRGYVEYAQNPIDMLAGVLKEKGLENKKVGIELTYLSTAYYLRFRQQLPKTELVGSEAVWDELRQIKSAEEIALLKRAANITEHAIYDAWVAAHLGSTEKQIVDDLNARQLILGADSVEFSVLGIGPHTLQGHPSPGPTPIREGDIMRVDIGAHFDGYYSDVARVAVGGKANERQRDIYHKLRELQRNTIAMMKPGVRACDVYNFCVKGFEAKGIPLKMPHIGHSIGVVLHEDPVIHPANTNELKPGMVINIEPLFKDPGVAAYHLEDLVHVTPDGPEILSDYSNTEELFSIQ
ncbi:MAG: Xaa-Pro peptidase family protein [Chloroflexi bacterium]|nr:Xaa-Pro peptidase family protein [Chloroflexota bacterium]